MPKYFVFFVICLVSKACYGQYHLKITGPNGEIEKYKLIVAGRIFSSSDSGTIDLKEKDFNQLKNKKCQFHFVDSKQTYWSEAGFCTGIVNSFVQLTNGKKATINTVKDCIDFHDPILSKFFFSKTSILYLRSGQFVNNNTPSDRKPA